MNWWQALILGIIEGVTEYLPVSSTGHLILVAWVLGLNASDEVWRATSTFNIVIQAGAILAIVALYWRRLGQIFAGLIGRNPVGLMLARNIVIAFLPAAVLGSLFADTIEAYLFKPWPVVGALFAGAWLMIAVAYSRRLNHTEHRGRDLEHITIPIALLIGFGQCLAMWPGTSRSMMTIVAALMLGLRPRAAAEFSFLLGLITLSAATGYKLVFSGTEMIATIEWPVFMIGLMAATVSAALAVRWFVSVLIRHGVAPFGWYRLGLSLLVAICIWAGWLTVPAVP